MGQFGTPKRYDFEHWKLGDSEYYPRQDSTGGAAQAARKASRTQGMSFKIRSQSAGNGGERGVLIERIG